MYLIRPRNLFILCWVFLFSFSFYFAKIIRVLCEDQLISLYLSMCISMGMCVFAPVCLSSCYFGALVVILDGFFCRVSFITFYSLALCGCLRFFCMYFQDLLIRVFRISFFRNTHLFVVSIRFSKVNYIFKGCAFVFGFCFAQHTTSLYTDCPFDLEPQAYTGNFPLSLIGSLILN